MTTPYTTRDTNPQGDTRILFGRFRTPSADTTAGIRNFQLVTSGGTVLLDSIQDGDTINVRRFNTTRFNIRAITNGNIGNINFALNGPINLNRNENFDPYHVFGDLGRFTNLARRLPVGNYRLTATFPSSSGGADTTRTLNFVVVDAQPLQDAPVAFIQMKPTAQRKSNVVIENLSLSLYPNPTKDWTTIQFDGTAKGLMRSRIIDQAGRMVKEMQTMKDDTSVAYRLDLSDLANGVYFIQTVLGNSVSNARVVISK